MNILEKYLGGHVTVRLFGFVITVFGFNAMHGAVEISRPSTGWGYLVFEPPMWCFGKWWHWKLFYSPNATPRNATFAIGPGLSIAYADTFRAFIWQMCKYLLDMLCKW